MTKTPEIHLSNNRRATVSDTPRTSYRYASKVVSIPSKRKSACVLDENDIATLVREALSEERLIDLAEGIKRRQYYGEVRSYADSIAEDVKDGTIDDAEGLQTRLHEDCDGAGQVIYTGRAMDTLRYSDNDGAYAEEFGSDGITDGDGIDWSALAYAAFHRDVTERVEDLIDGDIKEPWQCNECQQNFSRHDDLNEFKHCASCAHVCPTCDKAFPAALDDECAACTEGRRDDEATS